MMRLHSRGFTLIELLVVIAIIGILAAVVLASLNTARAKGNDAGVRSNLHTVETQSAIFTDDNNSYGTFDDGSGNPATCPAPGTIGGSIFEDPTVEAAVGAGIIDSAGGTSLCVAADSTYAAAISRPPGSTSVYWCVDSTGTHCGNDGGGTSQPISGGACIACTVTN